MATRVQEGKGSGRDSSNRGPAVILQAALVVALVFAAYYPALRSGFIWDDDSILTQNLLIKAPDGLHRFWLTTEPQDYWPVTMSSFWFEWRLWGMNPAGYHAVNIGLHAIEACLLWAVLRRLRVPGAYLAALLFAVHPVNVESVAWIAERKNMLAMLFFLLSIACFLRTRWFSEASGAPAGSSAGGGWYGLSVAAFALAMLSKGSVAILPVVILGIILWHRGPRRGDGVRALPFFLVAGVLAAVDIWFQGHHLVAPIREASILQRLLGAAAAVWFYLWKAILPADLMFFYPKWRIAPGHVLWWLPLTAAAAVTLVLWWNRRGPWRPALFAWSYFCLALLPVMGFTDVYFMRYSLVADHYQHLALLGVVTLAAACWAKWMGSGRAGSMLRLIPLIVIGGFAFLTWRQSKIYRDSDTLFTETQKRNPDSWECENYAANALLRAGRLDDAIAHYERGLRLGPEYAEAYGNLGVALSYAGRVDEAIAYLQEAVRLEPDFVKAHYYLGLDLAGADRLPEAVAQYERTLRISPDHGEVENSLGLALSRMNRLQEAIVHYGRAVALEPGNAAARRNLGAALNAVGWTAEGAAQLEQAQRLAPVPPQPAP